MPLRVNYQTVLGIVDEKLTNKPEIRGDMHVLADVFRNLVDTQQVACDSSTFKLHLQSGITKSLSAASRLLEPSTVSALNVAGIDPLERFAVLHYSSVHRAFLRGLESVIGAADYDAEKVSIDGHSRAQSARSVHDEISRALDLITANDVPFTLAVNPSVQLSTYYQEQLRIVSAIIGYLRAGWRSPAEFNKCIEIAMRDYGAWASASSDSAISVRSFLNYEQQQAQRNLVADDVHGLSIALQDWIKTNYALSERRRERWQAYRKTLMELPDEKVTMFDESFGVRKVFVQPLATYKVAGIQRTVSVACGPPCPFCRSWDVCRL